MRINTNYFLVLFFVLVASSCQTESELTIPTMDNQLSSNLTTADFEFGVATAKIDFDKGNFEAGDIVSKIYCPDGQGPITVMGLNPDFPNDNAAMIFDSSIPTGDDEDLGTPNESFGGPGKAYNSDPVLSNSLALNNVLIVSEDLDSSDPNDASITGVALWLDFSALGLVTLYAMDVLDVNNPAYVQLLDADDNELLKVDIPKTGDNGLAMVDLGPTSGVAKMHVVLNGSGASSGAIDNICFEKEETGCTFTLGYWKNHANPGDNKYNSTWDLLGPLGKNEPFFLSGKTYIQAISAGGGNAYYQLSQQYVAAVLNALGGASTTAVDSELAEAKSLFEIYTPAQIGALQGNNPTRKKFIELSEILDKYNNGIIGPGHCDKQEND